MMAIARRRGLWICVGIAVLALLVGAVVRIWVDASTLSDGELRSVTDEAREELERQLLESQSPKAVFDAFEDELESAAFRQDHPAAEAGLSDHDTIERGAGEHSRMVYYAEVRPVGESEPAFCVELTETEGSIPANYYFETEYVDISKCEL